MSERCAMIIQSLSVQQLSEHFPNIYGNWADNLVAAGRDANSAACILEDAAVHLRHDWGLEMGADSKEVLVLPGAMQLAEDCRRKGWQALAEMKCLGQILAANGSIEPDYAYTKQQLWKAYWANMRDPRLRTSNIATKITLMKRCLTPSVCYRCPRWPLKRGTAQKLDNLQTEMVMRCLRLPPQTFETRDAYFMRARQQAAQHISNCRWSNVWESRVHRWRAHILRHPECWSHRLLKFHDEAWLQHQRAAQGSPSVVGGRTGTRGTVGRATVRWPGNLSL